MGARRVQCSPPHTQAETYLPNSPGSTVQGSELGEGRSPHSLSSCSSLSHLPEGRRNFTRTPPVTPVPASTPYSTLPVPPEKGQCCKLPKCWPKGTVMQWEVAGPHQRGPATWGSKEREGLVSSASCLSPAVAKAAPSPQPNSAFRVSLEHWLTPNLWRTIKSYFYRKLFHLKCLFQKTKRHINCLLFLRI